MIPAQASPARRNKIAHLLALRRGELTMFVSGVLLPLGIFVALAAVVAGNGARGWEAGILDMMGRHYRQSIVVRLGSALDVGSVLAATIVFGAFILLLKRGRRREALFCMLAVGGVVALDVPLKEMFRRPSWSPSGFNSDAGYSFPSGYAMASLAILAAITLVSPRRWAKAMLIVGLPLLVGVGVVLVYAWWHYPSDVVGGWCFALSWVTALWLVIRPRQGATR
jgi:undecaprenyl-diphosphatase